MQKPAKKTKKQTPPRPPVAARNGPRSAEAGLRELKTRWLEISELAGIGALLSWDQATYMPKRDAATRGRQCALMSRLLHERRTDPELGRLLDRLAHFGETLPADSDEARLIRVARRDFEKATRVPARFVERSSAVGSASYDAWTRARPNNDFGAMRPYLETMLDLSREYVEF